MVKNDSRNADWSFEDKSTSGKTYSLSREVLATAEKHALADRRKMALVITYFPARAQPAPPKRYVVMTEDDFLEREQRIKQLEEDAWAYNDLRNS
jgi:hypothetical protein